MKHARARTARLRRDYEPDGLPRVVANRNGFDAQPCKVDRAAGVESLDAGFAKLAREMRPGLPIVYASGRRSMDQISTVPDSVFLPKPYSLTQVDQTLARIGEK